MSYQSEVCKRVETTIKPTLVVLTGFFFFFSVIREFSFREHLKEMKALTDSLNANIKRNLLERDKNLVAVTFWIPFRDRNSINQS